MTEEQRRKKREYMRQYRERKHGELKEKLKKDYLTRVRKDGMTVQEYYKKYYVLHRDQIRQTAKRWRERNPEKVKANNARSYARRRAERIARQVGGKIPDTDKAKALFKNPTMAAHFQWLIDKAKARNKEKSI